MISIRIVETQLDEEWSDSPAGTGESFREDSLRKRKDLLVTRTSKKFLKPLKVDSIDSCTFEDPDCAGLSKSEKGLGHDSSFALLDWAADVLEVEHT